jgi:hypothetical protein
VISGLACEVVKVSQNVLRQAATTSFRFAVCAASQQVEQCLDRISTVRPA